MSVPQRLTAWLLRLYPRAFRQRFGGDMMAMARDLDRESSGRPLGRISLIVRILADAATAIPRAHHFESQLATPKIASRANQEIAMATLRHDLRIAGRRLRTHPGFTLVAALTLAFGIGANTAIFSVIYGVLLRPLGVAEADRLTVLSFHDENDPADAMGLWPAHFEDLEDRLDGNGVASLTSFVFDSVTLMGDGEPEELGTALLVDGSFFATLAVTPLRGRLLDAGDVLPNRRGTVCVINETLWHGRFGGDSEIVGTLIELDGAPVTIVGVVAATIPLPQVGIQLWMPQGWDVTDSRLFGRLGAIARLEPGTSIDTARGLMAAAAKDLFADHARFDGHTISPLAFRETVVGAARPALLGAFGAAGLILLIACANVASLMLSRAVVRGREMATRRALGADRRQIASQLLSESVLLSCLGGGLGVLLAFVLHRSLIAWAGGLLPRIGDVRLDLPVLAFTGLISVVTGVLFGLAPVVFACGRDLALTMRGLTADRASLRSLGMLRARQFLVVSQVAVAVVLVSTAALFLRSLAELKAVDLGFRTADVGGARIYLDDLAYADDAAEVGYFERLLERVRATPGIAQAGITSGLPLDAQTIDYDLPYVLPGETEDDSARQAHFRTVSPGYLETLGVPLLSGRALSSHDRADTEPVAMINDTFARLAWPGRDPVGEQFAIYGGSRSMRVIGVVGDVHFHGPAEKTRPAFFVPFTQVTYGAMTVVAQARDGGSATRAIRAAALAIDGTQPVHSTFTLAGLDRGAVATQRFYSRLLALFAGVALLLAAAGIYGVFAFWVNESRRELGIRLAIGAEASTIVGLVLRRSLATTAVGVAVGLLTLLLAGRVLDPLLFAVKVTDLVSLGAVVALLGVVALVASLVPALRAARIDPTTSLRAE